MQAAVAWAFVNYSPTIETVRFEMHPDDEGCTETKLTITFVEEIKEKRLLQLKDSLEVKQDLLISRNLNEVSISIQNIQLSDDDDLEHAIESIGRHFLLKPHIKLIIVCGDLFRL